MDVVDLIDAQDELKSHTAAFVLWPRQWQGYHRTLRSGWHIRPLEDAESPAIPTASGVYTILVQPGIASHPACSYLMYVGRTGNLRARFGNYLNRERRTTGRPRVLRLLNRYSDYLWFCYSRVPRNSLRAVEEDLIRAYMPPCNDQYPAELRPAVKAF